MDSTTRFLTLLSMIVFVFYPFSHSYAQEEEVHCGKIIITHHGSCPDLQVDFQLSSCQDKPFPQSAAEINCSSEFHALAQVKTPHALYLVNLAKGSDNQWTAGPLRRQPGNFLTLLSPPSASVPIPTLTAPQSPSPFIVKGHFRARAEKLDRTDLTSERSQVLMRVRPFFQWSSGPQTRVVLELQAAKAMGEVVTTPGLTSNTRQETSGQSYDPTLGFHQAYGEYTHDNFTITLGRQILRYGDELVLSPSDWGTLGRTFDAVRGHWTHKLGSSDFFASSLVDSNTTSSGTTDRSFYGLYNSLTLGQYAKNFDLYALLQSNSNVKPVANIWSFGTRLKSNIHSWFYRLEYTLQTEGTHGWQGNVEAGYEFPVLSKLKTSLEYFVATENYNMLFGSGHSYLGYADVVGRRNVEGLGVHANLSLTSKSTLQLDYYSFQRKKNHVSAFKKAGTALGSGNKSRSKDIGQEFDLTFKTELVKSTAVLLGVSYFINGQYLKEEFSHKNPSAGYAQVEIKF